MCFLTMIYEVNFIYRKNRNSLFFPTLGILKQIKYLRTFSSIRKVFTKVKFSHINCSFFLMCLNIKFTS